MKNYILTGAPGCGKTSLIHALQRQGFSIVTEAATDIIASEQRNNVAEPWRAPGFINRLVRVQKSRQLDAFVPFDKVCFYDRSPLCTYSLALYLGVDFPRDLRAEIEQVQKEGLYESRVFFIENLGFVDKTPARQISFAEAVRFERIHKEVYQEFGCASVLIPAAPLEKRISLILDALGD